MKYSYKHTVELRSKRPDRKGNPPVRETFLGSISYFPIIQILAIKDFQSMGKLSRSHKNPWKQTSTVTSKEMELPGLPPELIKSITTLLRNEAL